MVQQHLLFFTVTCCVCLVHALLFQPIQSASSVYEVNIPYYVPEGVSYHQATDRIILSSLSTGEIRAFPNTNELNSINKNGSSLLYPGSHNGIYTPIVGVKVYGNTLYGAVGSLPPLPGPFYGGLLILDLQNPSNVELVDFSSLYDGTLMTPNDVVYSSSANAIFVTDFYGYRIFRYDLSTLAVTTILTRGVLCTICSLTAITYDGPNGIATKDDYLIVARSGTVALGSIPAIVKVPIDNPSLAAVIPISPSDTTNESILDGFDGLVFDATEEILYATNNGKDLIVAIRSRYGTLEDWSSGQVISTFFTKCQYKDPSSSTVIPQTGDVVTICTEQFGSGPYALKRLAGVANNYGAADAFSYDLTLPGMIPESLSYQPSTDSLLYSSYGHGAIYSTYNPSQPSSSGYSLSDGTIKTVVTNGTTALPSSIALLGIQVDPKYDHLLWSAYNSNDGKSGGVVRCNTLKGSCDVILNLDTDIINGQPYTAFYNDVTIDPVDGTVYTSDILGGHKIEAITPKDRSGSSDVVETRVIASDVCVDCSYTCDGTGFCGPNGLALISNGKKKASALIAAAFSYTTASNGFFRVNIKDGSKTLMTVIPNTFIDHLDGIRFDDKNEFLFVAAYGTNSISAYYSCDDWKTTMYLAGVFASGCSDGTSTSVAYTSSGDLIITCVNNFGAGPYTSTRITNIRSRLLGVSYSSMDDYCDGDEVFDLDEDGDGDDEDDDDDEEVTIIVLIVLTCVMGIIAFAYALAYHMSRGDGEGKKQTTELSSVKNSIGPSV